MNLIEAIKKTEFSIIESNSHSDKFSFSLFILNELKPNNPLIISTINKTILQKRIENLIYIKNNSLQETLNKIKIFSLKNNWELLKSSYGYDLLIEDLTKLIKDKKPDVLIFHKLDLMFNEIETDFGKIVIETLINLKNSLHFKLFITTNTDSFISEFSESYADIIFLIENNDFSRKIIVKNSIFPLENYEYTLSLDTFEIKELKENQTNNKKPTMLIISKNKYFINLHKYLFEKYFKLSFASTIGETIKQIMENPEFIIYQTENDKADTTICTLVKENQLNSKIVYFVNKDFIRMEDKMKISSSECYEILPNIFNIEEYIYILEKATNNHFYTKTIQKLPIFKEITTFQKLNDIIENLYNEKIFFSIIKINKKINNYEKNLRTHDFIYKTEKSICIILIDITKNFLKNKLKDKFNLKENEYEIIESPQWPQKKDFCK